jgi:hypothetical protein
MTKENNILIFTLFRITVFWAVNDTPLSADRQVQFVLLAYPFSPHTEVIISCKEDRTNCVYTSATYTPHITILCYQ